MTRDNPRLGGDPYRSNDATSHVDRSPTNLEAFEVVRIPTNIHLARYRYATDPRFNHIVEAAVRHLPQFDTVDDVFDAPGKRIKASKALIGTASEPGEWGAGVSVEVMFEDEDEAAFAEWIDAPVSAFEKRVTPDAIVDAKDRATGEAYAKIAGLEDAFDAGDITLREFEAAVGRVVNKDLPTPTPPDDREVDAVTFDGKQRGIPWRRIAIFVALALLFIWGAYALMSPL